MRDPIQVGNKVQWMHIVRLGRSVDLSTRYGVVTAIDGDIATVVPDGKHQAIRLLLTDLKPTGEKSAVNDFAQAIFAANRERGSL